MTHSLARLRSALPSQQWERNAWVLTGSIFVAFSGFTIVMPFLPLYVRELGVTDPAQVALWSGLIFGVSPLLAGLMAPIWGLLADRFGHKAMFLRSLIVFVFIAFFMGLATSVVQLFALRVLWGIFGGMGAMAMTMISVSAPQDRAGAALGRLQSAMLLTNASGPLLGGVLAGTIGVRRTFFVSACLYVAALIAMTLLFKDAPRSRVQREAKARVPFREVLLLPTLLPLIGVLFLSQFVDRSMNAFLPLYIEQLGTPERSVAFWAGFLTSFGAIVSAIAASAVGRLAGRRPIRTLLLATLLGGVVATMLLAGVQSTPQLFVARVLLALMAGGTVTLAFTIASRHLPQNSRGASFGLISTGSMVGGGLSPVVAGVIAAASLRYVFLTGAVLYAVSVLIALRLPRMKAEPQESLPAAAARGPAPSIPAGTDRGR
ncbi:MAG: MFS transporter [Chloroflexia bacterium]|nr:MFS transporter [Chloroflexia bacterium]